jgi:hypothetical protein
LTYGKARRPKAYQYPLAGKRLAFFMYGKKEKRIPQMLGGLALMVYPYFVDGLWLILGIGVLLVGLLVAAVRLGW